MKKSLRHGLVAASTIPLIALAQTSVPYMEIGSAGEYRLAVSVNSAVNRVGNAALVRVVALNEENKGFAALVLVACDGSWITTAIQTAPELYKPTSFGEMFALALQRDEPIPLDVVNIQPSDETQLFFARPLLRRAQALCKGAAKEPRNMLLPIVDSSKLDDTGTSIALVLGTSSRTGQTIDLWYRTTAYKRTPIILEDGRPWVYQGEVMKRKEATGKYSMEHNAVNCKERSMSVFEVAEYQDKNSSPNLWSIARDKMTFTSAIPGSVGEVMLDSICTLYGSK